MDRIVNVLFVFLVYNLIDYWRLRLLQTQLDPKNKLVIEGTQLYMVLGLAISLYSPWLALAYVCLLMALVSYRRLRNERKKKRAIAYYGYKIFKFLINQTSSGIKVSDALQSLYQIVDDKTLRGCLIEVSASFNHTANLHQSLDVLRTCYQGLEVDSLCVAIEQGIETGCNFETLVKMEGLLFKKYVYQIQRESVLRKKRGILATLYLCIIVVLMVAVPVFMDMVTAFNQIFS